MVPVSKGYKDNGEEAYKQELEKYNEDEAEKEKVRLTEHKEEAKKEPQTPKETPENNYIDEPDEVIEFRKLAKGTEKQYFCPICSMFTNDVCPTSEHHLIRTHEQEIRWRKWGFDLHTVDELMNKKYSDDMWRVDEIIPKTGITFLAGKSGCFKSWITIQMAIAISQGSKFWNFNTHKCKVLYLDNEMGAREVQRRFSRFGHTSNDIMISHYPKIKFNKGEDYEPLERYLQENPDSLIIMDTFIRFHDGSENDSTAMNPILNNIKRLSEVYNSTFIIIHHLKKTNGKDKAEIDDIDLLRGSSDIYASADSILYVEDLNFGVLRLKQIKRRSGEKLQPIRLEVSKQGNAFNIKHIGTWSDFSLTDDKNIDEEKIYQVARDIEQFFFDNNIKEFQMKDLKSKIPHNEKYIRLARNYLEKKNAVKQDGKRFLVLSTQGKL